MIPTTALQPVHSGLPTSHAEAEIDTFVRLATAASSRDGYRADFAYFSSWCDQQGLPDMPASPQTAARYLAHCARQKLRPATIARRTAAIRYAHQLARMPTPTDSTEVRLVLKGIRRDPTRLPPVAREAMTAPLVRRLLATCQDDMKGRRDRALLAIGFAGALRRSELVALQVADVAWVEDGIRLRIRRSKTDQEGQGQEIAIPHGSLIRPVKLLREWLEAAEISDGHIFRQVNKGGRVGDALDPHSVGMILKRRCRLAELDPAIFGSHSLRSGFLTSGAMSGSSVFKLLEVSRHKSIETLRAYVKRADLFDDHAGAAFL
jgi:integrase